MQLIKNLFTQKPVLEADTKAWLLDCVAWAISQFDQREFETKTKLVLPNNHFYPGRVDSVHAMAKAIFDKTVEYCGMTQWPLELVNPQQWQGGSFPQISCQTSLRGETCQILLPDHLNKIQVGYNPEQINQPQDMIASFVQQLANILFQTKKVLPPAGNAMGPAAIDVLSCVMGFGVIFANTAYQFRGGCGSCYNPRANRQATLPENDVLYVLAIFSVIKSIAISDVKPHLKRHLRGNFKAMYKDVTNTLKAHEGGELQLLYLKQ